MYVKIYRNLRILFTSVVIRSVPRPGSAFLASEKIIEQDLLYKAYYTRID